MYYLKIENTLSKLVQFRTSVIVIYIFKAVLWRVVLGIDVLYNKLDSGCL